MRHLSTRLLGACLTISCGFSPQSHAATITPPASSPSGSPSTTQTTSSQTQPSFHIDMKQALDYLASDQLEGRYIGTPGIASAGDFISDDFKRLGLKPLPGQSDYFQTFNMTTAVAPDPSTQLKWGETALKTGTDFVVTSFSGEATFSAPLVFAGYGISSKEQGYDDYANLDVKGKAVLALRFEPHNTAGTSRFAKDDWSPDATLMRKAKTAADHGAVALILVNPPTYHLGDPLLTFSRSFNGEKVTIPVLQVPQTIADAWMKSGGAKDLKTIQADIDANAKPASVDLKEIWISGKVAIQRTERQVRNVLAMLPGQGPTASEYVVVGAHYDHLGHGAVGSLAPGSHAIFNGADDNASGTTAMLKIADDLSHAAAPSRTIVFAAWTAEEEGLIGSAFFMNHPLVPLDKIEANLNLDMVGRMRNQVLYVGGAGTADDFDALVKKADVNLPIEIKSFGRGGIGPSDHMSFALKKIPVLFLFSGLHADYHRPSDKPGKINYDGMKQVVAFAERIVDGLETLPREKYVDAADCSGGMQAHLGPATGSGASLGVIPDYSGDDSAVKGVRLSGVVPGSAAASAGLKEGDILLKFGANKIDTLYDLSDELARAKPGDKIILGVQRGKDMLKIDATLTARKSE